MQLEKASEKLLDYGLLGIVVIALAFFLFKMWEKINADQAMWRTEAIESRKAFIDLSTQQNLTNQKLIDIRERDIDQEREHHDFVKKKLEDMPLAVRRELKNELNHRNNTTSAG